MAPALMALIPVIGSIIDKIFPNAESANQAKLKLFELQSQGQLEELKGAVAVITAEASGSWLQRNWRPIMMLIFTGLIVARWFGFAAPNLSELEYAHLWDIVELGIGGYVIGRSVEKVVPDIAEAVKSKKG